MKTYAAIMKDIERAKAKKTESAQKKHFFALDSLRYAIREENEENRKKYAEEYNATKADYLKEAENNDNIDLTIEILRDNAKQALKNELLPVIVEIWNKYEGKPRGEKTRSKISEELKAATGYYIYIGNKYDEANITIYTNSVIGDVELVTMWNGAKQPAIDSDNKIVKLSVNMFRVYCCGEYVENVNKHIKELKKAHAKAKEAEKALEAAVAEYNKLTRGKIAHANAREGVKNYLV